MQKLSLYASEVLLFMLQLYPCRAFTLAESDHRAGILTNVSLPHTNSSHPNPINSVSPSSAIISTANPDTKPYYHQWDDKFTGDGDSFYHCPNTTKNCSGSNHHHHKKLEQIVWDMLVEEDGNKEEEAVVGENVSWNETTSSSELTYKEEEGDEQGHSRSKPAMNLTVVSGRIARKKYSRGQGKKVFRNKPPKWVSGMAKYNEYKRWNSMNKRKNKDPALSVNANQFSGGGGSAGITPTKNKNTSWRKRKGAKKGRRATIDLDQEVSKGPQPNSDRQ